MFAAFKYGVSSHFSSIGHAEESVGARYKMSHLPFVHWFFCLTKRHLNSDYSLSIINQTFW